MARGRQAGSGSHGAAEVRRGDGGTLGRIDSRRGATDRTSRIGRLSAFVCLSVLAACDGRAARDSAQGPATGWFLEEELRIVGPPEGFGVIEAVAADADDNIYVLDRTDQQVFAFDPSGAFSHAIARSGEGPGELSRASGLSVGPANRIWVPDPATARVSVFERDGSFVAALPRRGRGYPGTGRWDRSVGPDGLYTDWRTWFPGRVRGSLPAETQIFPLVLVGAKDLPPEDVGAGTVPSDSLPPLEYTAEMVEVGGRATYRNFYAGGLLYALENGREIWFGHSREYRVYKRSLAGDTLLVVSLDEAPAPVTQADADAVRDILADSPEAEERLAGLPAEKPILRAIFADGTGTLYVVPETRDIAAGTAIDAFDSAGQYLGRATLPDPVATELVGSLPAYATSRYLLLAGVGDDLAPYVTRLGIRRLASGS